MLKMEKESSTNSNIRSFSDFEDNDTSILNPRKRKSRTKDEKLEANRKSAADSRLRKRLLVSRLQDEVVSLRHETTLLRLENAELKKKMDLYQNTLNSCNNLSLETSFVPRAASPIDLASHTIADNIPNINNLSDRLHPELLPFLSSDYEQQRKKQLLNLRLQELLQKRMISEGQQARVIVNGSVNVNVPCNFAQRSANNFDVGLGFLGNF